ncbi:uncharacterized protein J7T54_005767 [Emericellopsis cladophorae]|uniref:Uncharacterized protein n=1 Tax=Emericellopsis cladophorae TaxID=2686198 RepID=A0A9Q0BBW4_9HYPO|nr:uncharacterized protein J7T54_005767 [Emericellopsis cladophorae]KAI6779737.1 hypothetical protein J7T54_005767 [Emericellopsis cladophorae]
MRGTSHRSCIMPGSMPVAWITPFLTRTPDWIYSEASNMHLTNDKSWFENDFVEYDSHISNSRAAIASIPVRGVGSVVLPVKQSVAGQGFQSNVSLRLENVLYVPDYPVSVIGRPIKAVASVQFSSATPRGALVYKDGSVAATFLPGRDFYQVTLRESHVGAPLGRSVLDEHPEYGTMVGFTWPDQEVQKWRYAQAALRSPPKIGTSCRSETKSVLAPAFVPDAMAPRSRKRGMACDDEVESSPRRVKRSRAMDEMEEFGSPRSMVWSRC